MNKLTKKKLKSKPYKFIEFHNFINPFYYLTIQISR